MRHTIIYLRKLQIFQLHTTIQRKIAVSGVFLLAAVFVTPASFLFKIAGTILTLHSGLAASIARMAIYIEEVLGTEADHTSTIFFIR